MEAVENKSSSWTPLLAMVLVGPVVSAVMIFGSLLIGR